MTGHSERRRRLALADLPHRPLLLPTLAHPRVLHRLRVPPRFPAARSGSSCKQFASGLTAPNDLTSVGDGRLFVDEQNGQIRIVKNGALLVDPIPRSSPRASSPAR